MLMEADVAIHSPTITAEPWHNKLQLITSSTSSGSSSSIPMSYKHAGMRDPAASSPRGRSGRRRQQGGRQPQMKPARSIEDQLDNPRPPSNSSTPQLPGPPVRYEKSSSTTSKLPGPSFREERGGPPTVSKLPGPAYREDKATDSRRSLPKEDASVKNTIRMGSGSGGDRRRIPTFSPSPSPSTQKKASLKEWERQISSLPSSRATTPGSPSPKSPADKLSQAVGASPGPSRGKRQSGEKSSGSKRRGNKSRQRAGNRNTSKGIPTLVKQEQVETIPKSEISPVGADIISPNVKSLSYDQLYAADSPLTSPQVQYPTSLNLNEVKSSKVILDVKNGPSLMFLPSDYTVCDSVVESMPPLVSGEYQEYHSKPCTPAAEAFTKQTSPLDLSTRAMPLDMSPDFPSLSVEEPTQHSFLSKHDDILEASQSASKEAGIPHDEIAVGPKQPICYDIVLKEEETVPLSNHLPISSNNSRLLTSEGSSSLPSPARKKKLKKVRTTSEADSTSVMGVVSVSKSADYIDISKTKERVSQDDKSKETFYGYFEFERPSEENDPMGIHSSSILKQIHAGVRHDDIVVGPRRPAIPIDHKDHYVSDQDGCEAAEQIESLSPLLHDYQSNEHWKCLNNETVSVKEKVDSDTADVNKTTELGCPENCEFDPLIFKVDSEPITPERCRAKEKKSISRRARRKGENVSTESGYATDITNKNELIELKTKALNFNEPDLSYGSEGLVVCVANSEDLKTVNVGVANESQNLESGITSSSRLPTHKSRLQQPKTGSTQAIQFKRIQPAKLHALSGISISPNQEPLSPKASGAPSSMLPVCSTKPSKGKTKHTVPEPSVLDLFAAREVALLEEAVAQTNKIPSRDKIPRSPPMPRAQIEFPTYAEQKSDDIMDENNAGKATAKAGQTELAHTSTSKKRSKIPQEVPDSTTLVHDESHNTAGNSFGTDIVLSFDNCLTKHSNHKNQVKEKASEDLESKFDSRSRSRTLDAGTQTIETRIGEDQNEPCQVNVLTDVLKPPTERILKSHGEQRLNSQSEEIKDKSQHITESPENVTKSDDQNYSKKICSAPTSTQSTPAKKKPVTLPLANLSNSQLLLSPDSTTQSAEDENKAVFTTHHKNDEPSSLASTLSNRDTSMKAINTSPVKPRFHRSAEHLSGDAKLSIFNSSDNLCQPSKQETKEVTIQKLKTPIGSPSADTATKEAPSGTLPGQLRRVLDSLSPLRKRSQDSMTKLRSQGVPRRASERSREILRRGSERVPVHDPSGEDLKKATSLKELCQSVASLLKIDNDRAAAMLTSSLSQRQDLVEGLDAEPILDYLQHHGVLNPVVLDGSASASQRNLALIQHVEENGQTAVALFINALRQSGQLHLASSLDTEQRIKPAAGGGYFGQGRHKGEVNIRLEVEALKLWAPREQRSDPAINETLLDMSSHAPRSDEDDQVKPRSCWCFCFSRRNRDKSAANSPKRKKSSSSQKYAVSIQPTSTASLDLSEPTRHRSQSKEKKKDTGTKKHKKGKSQGEDAQNNVKDMTEVPDVVYSACNEEVTTKPHGSGFVKGDPIVMEYDPQLELVKLRGGQEELSSPTRQTGNVGIWCEQWKSSGKFFSQKSALLCSHIVQQFNEEMVKYFEQDRGTLVLDVLSEGSAVLVVNICMKRSQIEALQADVECGSLLEKFKERFLSQMDLSTWDIRGVQYRFVLDGHQLETSLSELS